MSRRRLHWEIEPEPKTAKPALIPVVLEQLGELEAGEGDFAAEANVGADFERLLVITARFVWLAEQGLQQVTALARQRSSAGGSRTIVGRGAGLSEEPT